MTARRQRRAPRRRPTPREEVLVSDTRSEQFAGLLEADRKPVARTGRVRMVVDQRPVDRERFGTPVAGLGELRRAEDQRFVVHSEIVASCGLCRKMTLRGTSVYDSCDTVWP